MRICNRRIRAHPAKIMVIIKSGIGAVVREWLILFVLGWACVSVMRNILHYRAVFLQNEQNADEAAAWINSPNKGSGTMANLGVRFNLYSLLEKLGNDKSL